MTKSFNTARMYVEQMYALGLVQPTHKTPEDRKKLYQMNAAMEMVRQDYQAKAARSWQEAENIIVR